MYSSEVDIVHPIAAELLLASIRFRLFTLEIVCRNHIEVNMHEDFFAEALIKAQKEKQDWLTAAVPTAAFWYKTLNFATISKGRAMDGC